MRVAKTCQCSSSFLPKRNYQLHLFGHRQKPRGKEPSGFGCGHHVASQLTHCRTRPYLFNSLTPRLAICAPRTRRSSSRETEAVACIVFASQFTDVIASTSPLLTRLNLLLHPQNKALPRLARP